MWNVFRCCSSLIHWLLSLVLTAELVNETSMKKLFSQPSNVPWEGAKSRFILNELCGIEFNQELKTVEKLKFFQTPNWKLCWVVSNAMKRAECEWDGESCFNFIFLSYQLHSTINNKWRRRSESKCVNGEITSEHASCINNTTSALIETRKFKQNYFASKCNW
jgi:hypothetical protein